MYTFTGWKLHLNCSASQAEHISKWLGDRYPHKVGRSSDQIGKGMTIYVGSYIDTTLLAKEISGKFPLSPAAGDVLVDDKPIHGNVWGRFDIIDPEWHQYGAKGIPLTKVQAGQLFGLKGETRQEMINKFIATNHLILRRRYGDYYQPS